MKTTLTQYIPFKVHGYVRMYLAVAALAIALFQVSPVAAQSASYARQYCWMVVDGYQIGPVMSTFEQCANAVAEIAPVVYGGIAYGHWGNFDLAVVSTGEVYVTPTGTQNWYPVGVIENDPVYVYPDDYPTESQDTRGSWETDVQAEASAEMCAKAREEYESCMDDAREMEGMSTTAGMTATCQQFLDLCR